MSKEVRQLQPAVVWNHFEDLNAVPRASKKEEQVLQFLKDFARGHELDFEQDDIGNLVIRKPATNGMEDRRPVILQSHVDMVHQKNDGTDFNFETDGIRSTINGEWVTADGTTLGADNGMGVAAMLAVLSSDDLQHPDVEALFTVDEEAGMTGAMNLKPNWLKGEVLMNLDTEEDNELSIGCAGGVDSDIKWSYEQVDAPSGHKAVRVTVSGLKGGHSGMDIIKGLGNANKIMNRFLLKASANYDLRISELEGGGLRNAIPRESTALLTIHKDDYTEVMNYWDGLSSEIARELSTTDPDFTFKRKSVSMPEMVMDKSEQDRLLLAIQCVHDGVKRLSPDVEDLVETSNNLARVQVINGEAEFKCLSRSDRESAKWDMAATIAAPFKLIGAKVNHSGSYPGWKLDPEAPMLGMMKELYQEMFNEEADVLACHAGLECGLIGQHYPNLEMVSFGPTIRGAHSPDERVKIDSVQKFWDWLKEALKRIPAKA